MRSGFIALLAGLSVVACAAHSKPAPCARDYAAMKIAEIEDIDAGENVLRRIIRGELAEEDAGPDEIAAIERMETVLNDRARPVDADDLVKPGLPR